MAEQNQFKVGTCPECGMGEVPVVRVCDDYGVEVGNTGVSPIVRVMLTPVASLLDDKGNPLMKPGTVPAALLPMLWRAVPVLVAHELLCAIWWVRREGGPPILSRRALNVPPVGLHLLPSLLAPGDGA